MAANNDMERLTKVPLWFADKANDTLTAEHWVRWIDSLKTTQAWTDEQTWGHTYHAFRGKALQFVDYLDRVCKFDSGKWSILKPAFIQFFGIKSIDSTHVANLMLLQKPNKKSHFFAFRISEVVDEFMSLISGNLPTTADPRLSTLPEALSAVIPDEAVKQLIAIHFRVVVVEFYKQGMDDIILDQGKTLFLNGLQASIRNKVKGVKSKTFHEAIEEASWFEKVVAGPRDKLTPAEIKTIKMRDDEDSDCENSEINAVGHYP